MTNNNTRNYSTSRMIRPAYNPMTSTRFEMNEPDGYNKLKEEILETAIKYNDANVAVIERFEEVYPAEQRTPNELIKFLAEERRRMDVLSEAVFAKSFTNTPEYMFDGFTFDGVTLYEAAISLGWDPAELIVCAVNGVVMDGAGHDEHVRTWIAVKNKDIDIRQAYTDIIADVFASEVGGSGYINRHLESEDANYGVVACESDLLKKYIDTYISHGVIPLFRQGPEPSYYQEYKTGQIVEEGFLPRIIEYVYSVGDDGSVQIRHSGLKRK